MQRYCGLIERGADAARQFQRVVIRPKMNEEHTRLFLEHMAVDRGHLDVAGTQRPDQRIYLVARNQKIAGDGRLATAGRLEVDGVGAAKRRALTGIPPSVAGSRRGMPN